MKIKTSELIGAALDYAVAKCEWNKEEGDWRGTYRAEYSTDWAQGGPIIEREGMIVGLWDEWEAKIHLLDEDDVVIVQRGDTPLVAAMRCYVAFKLGYAVEIPDQVIGG